MRHLLPALALFAAALAPAGIAPARAADPDPARRPVVYAVPGMDQAEIRAEVPLGRAGKKDLFMDLYYPPGTTDADRLPVLIFVSGGENVRSWLRYQSYGRLAAAHGFVGVIPDKRYQRGWEGTQRGFDDTTMAIRHLRENAAALRIDPNRLGLWTFSAGGRLTAIGLRRDRENIRCLITFYGVLDVSGQIPRTGDRERHGRMLEKFSPVHAVAARGPDAPPVFVARAGRDAPFINGGIDVFVSEAVRHGAPVRLVSYPDGEHGFDGLNDTDESRRIIRDAFIFAADHLGPGR